MAHALLHHSVNKARSAETPIKRSPHLVYSVETPIKRCRRILRRTVGGYVTGYLIHYANIVPPYRIH